MALETTRTLASRRSADRCANTAGRHSAPHPSPVPLALVASLAVLAASPLPGAAQQITGMVFDESSSGPVAGAEIRLLDASYAEVAAARTDGVGRFSVTVREPGRYLVVASAEGCMDSSPLEVELDASGPVNVMLPVTPLPGVRVRDRAEEGPDAYVFGRVLDRESQDPVEGATVTLASPTDTVRASTRWNGRFVVRELPPGMVAVRVEHLAYAPEERLVEMEAGRAYELDVGLRTEPIELPGIEVTVRSRSTARFLEPFYYRMDLGLGGYFMDREELEMAGPQPIGYVLNRMPSVSARRGLGGYWEAAVRGGPAYGCKLAVFVDRVLVHRGEEGGGTDMLELSTSEVEGVELYPGPATLPVEFNHPGVKCAVAVWTRRGG